MQTGRTNRNRELCEAERRREKKKEEKKKKKDGWMEGRKTRRMEGR